MDDVLLGALGGGGGSLLSLGYAYWQSKQNAKDIDSQQEDIDALEARLQAKDAMIDVLVQGISDFKVHVAETYVPVGRFVALEQKIDKIYEYILKK